MLVRDIVLGGRVNAYGMCNDNSARPHSFSIPKLQRLTWRQMLGVILSDLSDEEGGDSATVSSRVDLTVN
jgi:hypothetical protein